MRGRAIVCALWFGVLPWWVYERRCHHPGEGYLAHLVRNVAYALLWATWREDDGDRAFELLTNGRPPWHRWHANARRT